MNLSFESLRQKLHHHNDPTEWRILKNEKTIVSVQRVKDEEVVNEYVSYEKQTQHIQNVTALNGFLYRHQIQHDGVAEREWFRFLFTKDDRGFQLNVLMKTQEHVQYPEIDLEELDSEWNSIRSVRIATFVELVSELFDMVLNLPEYRLHFVTGNLKTKG